MQGHDVGVLELLQQAGLPNGSKGGALLLLQADLLQGHHLGKVEGAGGKSR